MLNCATINHDASKIKPLGPLAEVLKVIVGYAEQNRAKDSESIPGDRITDLYNG